MQPHDADSPLDSPFEPITGSELYTRAHEVFEAGEPLDALRLVDRALDLGHVDADICLLKGQILHELRRHEDALGWFDEAQAFSPRHADVLTWTARVHAARGRHRKALTLFRRVLEDDPFHAEAMLNRGISLFELGQYDDARAAWKQVGEWLEMNPEREAELLYWMARLERAEGRPEVARRTLDQATLQHATYVPIYAELADLLRAEATSLDDLTRSREVYERGLAVEPEDPALHNDLGNLLREMGDLGASLRHLTRAIELQPRHDVAWFNRGLTHEELGRLREALADFQHAQRIDPGDGDAQLKTIDLLLRVGRHEEAAAHLESLREQLRDDDPDGGPSFPALDLDATDAPTGIGNEKVGSKKVVLWCIADLHMRQALWAEGRGDYQAAKQHHLAVLRELPELYDTNAHRPFFASPIERWQHAIDGFAQAGRNQGDDEERTVAIDAESALLIGIGQQRVGQVEGAIDTLSQVVQALPEEVIGHVTLARAYAEAGQPEDSVRHLERAQQLRPSYVEVIWDRAMMLEALQRPEAAMAAYEQLLRDAPQAGWVHEPLARIADDNGQPGRALYHLHHYIAFVRSNPAMADSEASILAWMGRVALASDRPAAAVDHFQSALAVCGLADSSSHTPGDEGADEDDDPVLTAEELAEVRLWLGIAHGKLGRREEGRRLLERVAASVKVDWLRPDSAPGDDDEASVPDTATLVAAAAMTELAWWAAEAGNGTTATTWLAAAERVVEGKAPARHAIAAKLAFDAGNRMTAALEIEEALVLAAEEDAEDDATGSEPTVGPSRVTMLGLAAAVADALGSADPDCRLDAARLREEARAIAPTDPTASPSAATRALQSAREFLARRDAPAALRALEDAVFAEDQPAAIVAARHRLRAEACTLRGDTPGFLDALRATVDADPSQIESLRYDTALRPMIDLPAIVAQLATWSAEAASAGTRTTAATLLPGLPTAAVQIIHTTPIPAAHTDDSAAADDDVDLQRDFYDGIDWDSLAG